MRAATQTSDRLHPLAETPRRFQFSLRALFVLITLASLGLALTPKDASAIVGLLFVPQFLLVGWAMYRALLHPARLQQEEPDLSQAITAVGYVWGLVMPVAVVFALTQTHSRSSDEWLLKIFLNTIAAGPIVLLLMLLRVFRRNAHLAILHAYNTAISILPALLMSILIHMPRC